MNANPNININPNSNIHNIPNPSYITNNINSNNKIPTVLINPTLNNTPISVVSPHKNQNTITKNHPIYQ